MSSTNLFLKTFPPPHFLRMPAVGLDISHRSVRFLELVRSIHGLLPGRYAEKRIAASTIASDDVSSNKELRSALLSLKKQFHLSFVNVSLPEDKAYVFTLDLPRVDPAKVREAIEFRLEENVPLAPTEVIFDYVLVPSQVPGGSIQAVVTAFPKRIIESYRALLRDVGLTPLSFVVAAEAVTAAVVRKGSTGTTLIVNIGSKSTGIYIVVGDVLEFNSTLAFGGESLTAAIAKHFNVSVEEAQEIKKSESFLERKNTMQLFFSMTNSVSALRDEIARVATYWQNKKSGSRGAGRGGQGQAMSDSMGSLSTQMPTALAPAGNPDAAPSLALDPKLIDRVILCGNDSHLRGLDQYLLATLNVPVEIANVWTNVLRFEQAIPSMRFADSLDYAAAVGLALDTLHSSAPHA